VRVGLGQGPGELGGEVGAAQPGVRQTRLQGVEERRVAALGQLHLDLGPAHRVAGGRGQSARGDPVGGQLGEQPAVAVHEMVDVPLRQKVDKGDQAGAANAGAYETGEVVGQRVRERGADLVPYVRAHRQLEVPARVVAPGTAAQGDAVGGEPLPGGVVVRGVERDDALVSHLRDSGDPGQLGEAAGRGAVIGGLVLALDLPHHVHHDVNVVECGV
jgi:hypothetical protein